MRLLVRRLLGASALFLLFGLPLPGCSGQQQDEEEMEVSEQNEAENEETTENQATNEETTASQESSDEGSDESTEATVDNNAGAEDDLQEIIQEMNNAPAGDATAANASAPPPMQPAPAEATAPVNATADPMAAAAAAPPPQSSGPTIPFQPGGSPAGPGLPEIGSKMAYIVEKGDTLGKISQKIYGSPARWSELATLSGIPNPSRIYPGDLVYYTLDESALTFAAAYEATQRSEAPVQAGDTLATIAQRIYGTTTAWRAIWRQNDGIDNPDLVPPGMVIYYIAAGAATAAVNKARAEAAKLAQAKKAIKKGKGLAEAKVKTHGDGARQAKAAATTSCKVAACHGVDMAFFANTPISGATPLLI